MIEFEFIILKKLTHNSEYFGKIIPILQKKFFQNIGNQELFKLIKEYYTEYNSIPALTELVAKVKNVSNSEIRNEIKESLKIISNTEEISNIQFLIDETVSWVKDSLYLEALQVGSDGLMKKDDSLKLKAQQILDERSKISVDSDLGLDFDDIETMIQYYSERNVGILSQHKSLNKRLGCGFLPGTLSVILASQGVGKSLLMTDIISGIIKNSKNILLISLEMSDKELMKRVHANAMDLPINSLIDLSKTEGELNEKIQNGEKVLLSEEIISAYNRLKLSGNCGKLFIKDYPAGEFSALMLEQLIESYKLEKNIEFDIVFIDYLGIMKSDRVSPSVGLYSYIKSIGEEVRALAKKKTIPIISASQLNRGAINTDYADNSAVSDSIGTVMTADFMLFLLQTEEMKEKCEIVCKITKNRFTGITDTWMMSIDYTRMRFNDMIIQNPVDLLNQKLEIDESTGEIKNTESINSDFGIITAKKQEQAEKFAKQEIKDIFIEDVQKIEKHNSNKQNNQNDPFKNDLNDIFSDLGIEI